MTPTELGRHLVCGLRGPTLEADERRLLQHWQPAGVILFRRNVVGADQLVALTADLRATLPEVNAGHGPRILADHEGGTVAVLAEALGTPPSALALGIAGDAGLTRRVHRTMAASARAHGVDTLLAPVADVVHDQNPVIATRAFGRDPGPVGTQVVAAIEGLHRGGALACVKHWPGHGRPSVDSHLEACRVDATEAELLAVDLPPFLAAVRAGVDLVMVGHLQVPALDATGTLAPCSRPIVSDWLRGRLGFEGVVLTDALEMAGFGADPRDALAAGCDLLLHARPVTEVAGDWETWRTDPGPADEAVRAAAAARVAALPWRTPDGPGADDDAFAETRRRSVVVLWPEARDAPAFPPAPGFRWGWWDRASDDRLLRIPGDPSSPEASAEAFLAPLARALGSEPAPRASGGGFPSQPVDGWVIATLRPLREPDQDALRAALEASGARWVAILGDPSPQLAAGGDRGVVMVPGVAEADRRLLAEVLTGRFPVSPAARWGD